MSQDDAEAAALRGGGALRPPRDFGAAARRGLRRVPLPHRVALGLLLFGAVWAVELVLTRLCPPMDDIEQLVWVRALEWGYYKHPPLPTWMLWLPVKLFGPTAATVTLFGAFVTLATLWVFWCLLRRLRGSAFATLALLAVLGITFYNGRLDYYNHNIVLMLASTLAAGAAWMAFTTRRLRWWAVLGVVIGLGALAKYQIALTVVSVCALWLHQRGWRDAVHRPGLLLAALLALSIFVPHLQWLRSHDFAPVNYAMHSSLGVHIAAGQRLFFSANWLLDELFNRAMPAWLLLWAAWRLSRRAQRHAAPADPGRIAADAPDLARALLLAWGALPLLAMTAMGLVDGTDLQFQWGTAFLLFAVPAAMACMPTSAWDEPNWRRVVPAFLALQVVLLAVNVLTSPHGPVAAWRDRTWRSFDSALLASRIAEPARHALGGSIRYVVGPEAAAGALAMQLPEHPLVLIDGRFDRSPWIDRSALQRCGAVLLGDAAALPNGRSAGAEFPALRWQVRPGTAPAGCGP